MGALWGGAGRGTGAETMPDEQKTDEPKKSSSIRLFLLYFGIPMAILILIGLLTKNN